MKKCPYCAKEIQDEAIVCRYCGRDLKGTNTTAQQPKKTPAKKPPYLLVGVLLLVLICCGLLRVGTENNPRVTPTSETSETGANIVVISTFTPKPTSTSGPTETPLPTVTPTAIPEPIFLTSVGDSVFDIQKWEGPAILKIKYTGYGYFGVKNYPANSTDPYDLLVNAVGPYEGTVPLDFRDGEQTARFEVTAANSGAWEFYIEPLTSARTEQVPDIISGTGDDIVLIGGGMPDLLKADASQASGYFGIKSIADAKLHLLINELAPYTGTKILDPSTVMLIIQATGPWSLEITSNETTEQSQSTTVANSELAALIPGLMPVDVTLNLEQRGFSCTDVNKIVYYERTCTKEEAGIYHFSVVVGGREPFIVDFIDTTVLQFTTPSNEIAAALMGFVATMPYDNATPEDARAWVENTIPTLSGKPGGGKEMVTIFALLESDRHMCWSEQSPNRQIWCQNLKVQT